LMSCNIRIAASKSVCVCEVTDVLESCRSVSLAAEPCLLPKKYDSEFVLEFVLEPARELTFEFDLEIIERGRPRVRGAIWPTTSSSCFKYSPEPDSVSRGESGVSLTWCRLFALQSAYLEEAEAGESVANRGEFVFVWGFANRLWRLTVLWLLPMASKVE
jgi:hypothetical protein